MGARHALSESVIFALVCLCVGGSRQKIKLVINKRRNSFVPLEHFIQIARQHAFIFLGSWEPSSWTWNPARGVWNRIRRVECLRCVHPRSCFINTGGESVSAERCMQFPHVWVIWKCADRPSLMPKKKRSSFATLRWLHCSRLGGLSEDESASMHLFGPRVIPRAWKT